MKRIAIAIIVISSCQTSDKSPGVALEFEESTASTTKTVVKEAAVDFDSLLFESIYSYKVDNKAQRLAVNWIGKDSIDYLFESDYETCSTNYSGVAVNPYPNMDYEMDEDDTGISYPAIQFIDDNDHYWMNIRIAFDRKVARIRFKSNDRKECNPEYSNLLQKMIEIRLLTMLSPHPGVIEA